MGVMKGMDVIMLNLSQYPQVGESMYSGKLANGLEICVFPKQGFSKSYAFFAAKYGGSDMRYKFDGTWVESPAGVAHFLEHKMFDMPYGNALTRLSENGASPNAFTSAGITAYHFESTDKFEENLRILLEFVTTSHFTDESAQKEQGIIAQEIRMTEDDPGNRCYYNLMKCLYKEHPIRIPIAGSVESIAEIDAEILNQCHKAFYNPSNMLLCVAGDTDPERVYEIASEIVTAEAGEMIERDYGFEPGDLPVSSFMTQQMEVSQPQFMLGFKINCPHEGLPSLRSLTIADIASEILIGNSSELYSELYAEGLINSGFYCGADSFPGGAALEAGGESGDPEAVRQRILAQAESFAKNGVDRELFERTKRSMLGAELRGLNSFDGLCYRQSRVYFRGYSAFDFPEVYDGIDIASVEMFIAENLRPERSALSVIAPR